MAHYTLSDGTRVEIRPIRTDDAHRLRSAHARLSPESRYRRFLGAKPILSSEDVRYLVNVDGADHFALVATTPVADEESIIAVARFVRLRSQPDAAEFAIVVGDQYQRSGLGSELLSRLAAAASERGIARFRATALAENAAIMKLIDRLSEGRFESARRGATTEFNLALPGAGELGSDESVAA
jgi:RimJ/RimL family protein N-acetyltransferase